MAQEINSSIPEKRLYRSRYDRIIAGVCGGFAEYFLIDPILVRILWIIFGFMGFGIVAYIVCLIIMKENPHHDLSEVQPHQQNNSILIGAVLIILGLIFLSSTLNWHIFWFRPFGWRIFHFPLFEWDFVFPILLIVIGVIYIYRVSSNSHSSTSPKETVTNKKGESKTMERRFERSRTERMIGGVCGGLAKYLVVDVVIVRLIWALFTIFTGIIWGVLFYIVLLIVVPEESLSQAPVSSAPEPEQPPAPKKTTGRRKKSENGEDPS